MDIRGGYHKPIYTLCQALTLYAKLLCLKKRLKSWAQIVNWLCAQFLAFMKLTPGLNYAKNPNSIWPKDVRVGRNLNEIIFWLTIYGSQLNVSV